VRPSAQANPEPGERVCIIVPRSATPTVPPIWRVELRTPEARPEFSGADAIRTPAVIAGMIIPMLMPNNPRPIMVGQIAGGQGNTASGNYASISGGEGNTAFDDWTSVSGGSSNTAGSFVTFQGGLGASVSGGSGNTAAGRNTVVIGGQNVTDNKDNSIAPKPPFP
jgi:hypothetical protein